MKKTIILKISSCSIFKMMLLFSFLALASCKRFLEVELPAAYVPQQVVFDDEISATSAVKGLYVDLLSIQSFSSGSNAAAAALTGLSADELHNYKLNLTYNIFETNSLDAENGTVLGLWTTAYKAIYDANSIIEGIQSSTNLSIGIRDPLLGEALFIRAYCHFYLVNLFGDVPLVTTTSYQQNAKVGRAPIAEVYNQIKADLQQARILLSEDYPEGAGKRIRVNKYTATALLARVSLYQEDWSTAESMASVIIENTAMYQLVNNLDSAFLSDNKEALWQLRLPVSSLKANTTYEGRYFIIETSNDLGIYVLNNDLVNAFEPGDLRKSHWVGSYIYQQDTVYYCWKYKIKYGSDTSEAPESSTVFRLAEQFLLRAEARAKKDNLPDAITDLDIIRKRAGLPLIKNTNPGIAKADLLLAIERERRVELFTEGSHRWFDLKRTGRVGQVIGLLKPTWSEGDELYPIPASEMRKNAHLKYQNTGY